jgi:hypothetical protein
VTKTVKVLLDEFVRVPFKKVPKKSPFEEEISIASKVTISSASVGKRVFTESL